MTWDSAVCIKASLRTGLSAGTKYPNSLWGPSSLQFSGPRDSFPGVKWPGCNVDHSLPSGAEVRNRWRYTSAPPICLYGVDRGNFAPYLNTE
jgi:hypothetical protein